MLLHKVILENYCLYQGRHEFDLRPREKYKKTRPIVIFGGKNGAGKTTFLDAIRLTLYGANSLSNRVTRSEYKEILKKRIHRSKITDRQHSYAKVGVEFEFIIQGERETFYVERSWTSNGSGKINEFFKIEKDGKLLEDISPDHWQAFISDIVPERLSQLFFFDGEKIKSFAEDLSSNSAIAQAIQGLLGLDIVERLKTDLSIYLSKQASIGGNLKQSKVLNEIELEIEQLESEIRIQEVSLPEIETRIRGCEAELKSKEEDLQQAGAVFYVKRTDNTELSAVLKERIGEAEKAIRRECEQEFPFALCPNNNERLLQRLKVESEGHQNGLLSCELISIQKTISSELEPIKLNSATKKTINNVIDDIFIKRRNELSINSAEQCLELSERDIAFIQENIQLRVDVNLKRVKHHSKALEQAVRKLHKVEKELLRSPDKLTLQPLFSEIKELNKEIGANQGHQKRLSQEINKLKFQREKLIRNKQLLDDEINKTDREIQKQLLIKKIQPALDKYRDRLTKLKIQTLENTVRDCFNRLARKTDFVKEVSIDPNTFAVTTYDSQGSALPKEDLSSGEKQIFAIAMLWGLARTSGRPLPVVIDTPLGRLDSDHRKNLIEHYFPYAGHQVIMLSTDTEVDQELFRKLSPNISHSFHLMYDSDTGNTTAKPEYFWRS